ncbi:MAG TPA: hypothetical protein VIQ29_17895 [Ancylobacter sp.]
MRTTLLTLPFILMASSSLAQARPDSLAMSCASASALVRDNGAVVIGTGPNLFERFVASAGFCQSQRTEPAWIPTADQRQCLVGQRCRDRRIQMR